MTNAITLDARLAYCSGVDAANAQMRAAGRTAWNIEDRDLAVKIQNRLGLLIPWQQGGLKGLPRKFQLNHVTAADIRASKQPGIWNVARP
jgi:hypothetical protein